MKIILLVLLMSGVLFAPPWYEHTIANNFEIAPSIYAIDIDGDNNIDVLGKAGEC